MQRMPWLCLLILLAAAAPTTAPNPFVQTPQPAVPETQIDRLVRHKLAQVHVKPAPLCSDAVFVRRVFLDVIGTLPTAQETSDFLADKNPNKRRVLIDKLLERDEFADYWAMKWSDLLRIKAEFPVNLWPNAAQAYHHWVRDSIKQDKPYDRLVRELLVSNGSNFRVPEVNFYRAVQSREPQALAQAAALTFMGERAETWPAERLAATAVFFSRVGYKTSAEWKEEIVYFDPAKAPSGEVCTATFPDGRQVLLPADRDPRELFADWLTDPSNPCFARNITNRVWFWLMGRGIIHEPDDTRPDNLPSNPELLTYLQRQLIASRYDLKHIYRLILNSRTYQASSIAASDGPAAETNFACYPVRRLDAEVFIDALCQVTGTSEDYSSAIPEPFTFVPADCRSIALPDGSITSSFLEMFGRPPRDTGLELERNNHPTAAQRLHLLNSSHIQRKLQQSRQLQALLRGKRDPGQIITDVYLTILSRFPTESELIIARDHWQSGLSPRDALVDLAWALINSTEFAHRH